MSSGASPKILLVDDDEEFTDLLRDYLVTAELEVLVRNSGEAALDVNANRYDLMVLDIMMPGLDGIEVLRRLRAESSTPVVMLTARGDDVDRIVGLEIGADDYLAKPCNPRELLARIRAVLRRSEPSSQGDVVLENGNVELRPASRLVRVGGAELDLTSTEFSLLELLLRQVGSVITKAELSEQVLGRSLGRFDRSVDMHVSNLRRKLIAAGARENLIETIRGIGYQLTSP